MHLKKLRYTFFFARDILYRLVILLIFLIGVQIHCIGQERDSLAPGYKLLREDEHYDQLVSEGQLKRDFWDKIKFIPINQRKTAYVSLGGELRPRYEFFKNKRWGSEEDDRGGIYSQRLALHTNIILGKHIRLFGELYHGRTTSKGRPEITQDDELDLHQAFVDITTATGSSSWDVTLRIGRQQLLYGTSRLIGIRNGPNIRRSFDAGRIMLRKSDFKIDAFYGSEVNTLPGLFDNRRNKAMDFWGAYISTPNPKLKGGTDFYYYGFLLGKATFNDGTGAENRQTVGIRRYGNLGKHFFFNTELIYQFGKFSNKGVSAFAFEFDYHYRGFNWKGIKDVGLKFDYVSGDRVQGDSKLETFNPLFYNPTYFGLLSALTPTNLFDIHPSATFELSEQSELILDCDFFWRARLSDGVYIPPRVLYRRGELSNERYIGTLPGLEFNHKFSRHFDIGIESAFFIAGSFLRTSGEGKSTFYFANTLTYKF